MVQVKIRSAGREQFWSAGRKWTEQGRVVSVVDDDPVPAKFKRAKTDFVGNYVLRESQFKDGDYIPVVPARGTRAFWKDGAMYVRTELLQDGKTISRDFEVETELDFPAKDPEFQTWSLHNRKEHDSRNEITQSDYSTIRADSRFLAVEMPEPPEFDGTKARKR